MDVKKILGSNIRKYRKRGGLTQEQFAERLYISPKHLSNIEVGTKFVSAILLEKIITELDIPPASLFYSSDIKSPRSDDPYSKIDRFISDSADSFISTVKEKIREEL